MRSGVPPNNTDLLYVHDLKTDCIIGVWAWERQTRQTIILDLDIAVDIRRAAAHDKFEYALDYKALAQRVMDFVGESHFSLVETLIEEVAQLILREFSVPWVRVRLNKPRAISKALAVGLVIERSRIPAPSAPKDPDCD